MQQIKKISVQYSAFIAAFCIMLLPLVSFGQTATPDLGLVTCDTNCDFNALMAMINKIIKFALFNLVVPIAAVMFFYAGFLMVTAGGESAEAKTKAKGIFTNAVIGLVIAISAWIVIRTLLSILGFQGDWIGL